MNRKGPWEGYRQQAKLLPAFLCAHIFIKRETSGYEAVADLVFKMAGSLMADEFEIFRNGFRPVHFATLENKIACLHPVCEEAVFLQRAGLQQHYRIRHPEVIFLPKIEDAAGCLMQKLHARETRNILLELFEKRSGQVVFTY